METIDIEEVINSMTDKIEKMRENGELAPDDEFALMQPLANKMVTVIDNPDEPDITVITVTPISDFYRILPKINKRLNVYNTEEKGKDNE